jgi:2-oxoglutarate ferredoxin oxidoreductase subunit alpha
MTPATPLLNELAERQLLSNYFVFEMESEIGAVNAAIGSAITGAKAMVGTSGGGFDLMTEAVSLAGMAEVPIVTYLAQRPGPSTGVPTYTSQGDLNMARHCGHGEFPRVVSAPGEPVECAELTSQAFYLSQKYKVPAIIISDKHLAESLYAVSESPIITPSEKSAVLKKYNSYEHDLRGLAVEDAVSINKNFERRMQKQIDIEAEAEKFRMFKIYGEEKSKNLILFWGSTKGAVLDALKSVNARALQVLYMEPFSQKIKNEIEKARNVFVVENNATSQLSQLVAEKTGFLIPEKNRILKYDGRPFLSDELAVELKRRMR